MKSTSYSLRNKEIIIFGSISTSEKEILDITKAWLAISFAFAFLMGGSIFSSKFYTAFAISSITAGIGFLFHELGHKIVAQKYGCFAEFRSFDKMLLIAVATALFFGILFAAPGAVMISGRVNKARNGKISAAGPLVNLCLALIFLLAGSFSSGIIKIITSYGFRINLWLALFNMIPVWNFDGAKIFAWNKIVYGSIVASALILMFV